MAISARKSTSGRLKNRAGPPTLVTRPKSSTKSHHAVRRPVSFARKVDNAKNKKPFFKLNWDSASTAANNLPTNIILADSNDLPLHPLSQVVADMGKSHVSAVNAVKPFDNSNDPVLCKYCKKPMFISTAADHLSNCLRKRQQKAQRKKEDKDAKEAQKRRDRIAEQGKDETSGIKASSKKRKAGADPDDDSKPSKQPNRKKRKDDAKPGGSGGTGPGGSKNAKIKGPVDVEKQCGVKLPNDLLCARSLTCKSHSMGAKRAVLGRSLPYDVLLTRYQKNSHIRQHRALMDAAGALEDDEFGGPVDSEEETDAVMAAITTYLVPDNITGAMTMGAPAEEPIVFVPAKRKYHFNRLKHAMRSALEAADAGACLFSAPEHMSSPVLVSAS